jgi:hypothetical protein
VGKVYVFALLMAGILFGSAPRQEKTGAAATPVSKSAIEVTIALGGGLHGPVKSRFKVGEEIPVVISMNNAGDEPAKYCFSTTVIQNRPRLERDGRPIPYLTDLPERVDNETATRRCESSAYRRVYELQPGQRKIVDWITLGQRGIQWYAPLPPGHYELALMRLIECCQGQMVKSNKVAFDVVP